MSKRKKIRINEFHIESEISYHKNSEYFVITTKVYINNKLFDTFSEPKEINEPKEIDFDTLKELVKHKEVEDE